MWKRVRVTQRGPSGHAPLTKTTWLLYGEAIQRLGDCRMTTHLARAHLRNIFRTLGITSRRQLRTMQLP
jgi:hypothetical protein